MVLIAMLTVVDCDARSDDEPDFILQQDVAVEMRDGVVLRADIYRPHTGEPVPTLVYRTPYGKHNAANDYQTHLLALERGYAVVLQDVRGRYRSDGLFNPYRNEGNDGYDTIEWAAAQPWSNGDVGTFGLSYPGAVQWLAAIQSPPHLKAMVPAMTFSSPRNFFYMNGVFDLSWLPWIYFNIAPDARHRLGLSGPLSDADVRSAWQKHKDEILGFLPLSELPWLQEEAPFYFEWLRHPPDDPWWHWAEIRGNYARTDAAVLNLSGWYDEAYGPEGATTNHNGLVASRGQGSSRSQLILGPWQHGVAETGQRLLGELDFGPDAGIDYDAEVLDFFDAHLKKAAVADRAATVRYFVMGSNEWRQSDTWPPVGVSARRLCLDRNADAGLLNDCAESFSKSSSFRSDPAEPLSDPFGTFEAHDFQTLEDRTDTLIFETPPLKEAVTIVGNAIARLFVSCDCRDFDLWVRLLDVHPDGRAINLMSPGADVQRVSYRDASKGRQLVEPGEVYEVRLEGLITANRFSAGHRVRIQVSAAFAPHLSRNLQTGLLETGSASMKAADITVHHDERHPSFLQLPTIP